MLRQVLLPLPDEAVTSPVDLSVHFKDGKYAEFDAYLAHLMSQGWIVELEDRPLSDFPMAKVDGAIKMHVYGPTFHDKPEAPSTREQLDRHIEVQRSAAHVAEELADDVPENPEPAGDSALPD